MCIRDRYTVITLNQDGSFSGEYCDSDMGDSGDAYPHGKEYICNFSGRFDTVVQIDSNTYSMTLSEITTEKESGEEWIEAVSYTHLDVYKRQHYIHLDLHLCLRFQKSSHSSA